MLNYHEALGQVIREKRLGLGIPMRKVNPYISIGHLSEVERGKKELSSRHLPLVAKGLGMEAYELVLLAGYRMAGLYIPDTPKELFDEYADLMLKSN